MDFCLLHWTKLYLCILHSIKLFLWHWTVHVFTVLYFKWIVMECTALDYTCKSLKQETFVLLGVEHVLPTLSLGEKKLGEQFISSKVNS